MVQIELQNPFEWVRIGDVLRIHGPGLQEGTWTGLDRQTVFYPKDVIHRGAPSAKGVPIKFKHRDVAEAVAGFTTAVRRNNGGIDIEGIVFDKNLATLIEGRSVEGISPEINVQAKWDAKEERNVAEDIGFTAFAMVENPACEPCRVESSQWIRLEKTGLNGNLKRSLIDHDVFLEIAPKPRKEAKLEMSAIEGAQPSREEFFTAIKEKLKAATIDEENVSKVISVLEKVIKTPYPAAAPAKTPQYPGPEKGEHLTEAKIAEIFKTTMSAISADMEKPTKASFLRWMRREFKAAGFDRDAINKILAVVKKGIKFPYPYPAPAAKEMGTPDDVWEDEEFKALEGEVETLKADVQTKQTELDEAKQKLDAYQAAEKTAKEEAVTGLINSIKELDETFDESKLLEGVECLDARRSLLERYLEALKRIKPAIVLPGVSTPSEGEERVKSVMMGMFEDSDLKRLFPTEGGD